MPFYQALNFTRKSFLKERPRIGYGELVPSGSRASAGEHENVPKMNGGDGRVPKMHILNAREKLIFTGCVSTTRVRQIETQLKSGNISNKINSASSCFLKYNAQIKSEFLKKWFKVKRQLRYARGLSKLCPSGPYYAIKGKFPKSTEHFLPKGD